MKEHRSSFAHSRTLKLGPAVGDWSTIQLRSHDLNETQISTIHNINFDSLPKEKMRYVHYLHYRLAEKLVAQLSVDMDIKIELHTVTATQLSYEDFIQSQPNKVVQANFLIETIGKVQAILDWELADSMVDRLTGGKGEHTQTVSFSEIEQSILHAQMEQLIPSFIFAWRSVFEPDHIKMDFICGQYLRDKKISYRDAMMVFSCYVYFGNGELKKISWVYPAEILRKCLLIRNAIKDPIKKRVTIIPKTLKRIKVEIKAVLGKASLTMRELKQLQVGDIIQLDTNLESPLEVTLANKTRFYGQAGITHNHLCVQLIFVDSEEQSLPALSPASPPLPQQAPLPQEEFPTVAPSQAPFIFNTAEQENEEDAPPFYTPEDTHMEQEETPDSDEDEWELEESDSETAELNEEDDEAHLEDTSHENPVEQVEEDDFSWDNLDDHL